MRTPTKKVALPLAVAATLAAGAGAGAAVAGGPGKSHTPAKHAVKHRARAACSKRSRATWT